MGNEIDSNDTQLRLLMEPPQDSERFESMLNNCFKIIIHVLHRQYKTLFEQSDKIKEIDLTSARPHTMDAESAIGELSSIRRTKRNARVLTVSNLIKAKNNGTGEFLSKCPNLKLEYLINRAIPQSRKEIERERNLERKNYN